MSGFRQPEQPREQIVLWDHRLDDAIPEDHPVRLFDELMHSGVFALTFSKWEGEYVLVEGKPPYHPRVLTSLYLYGMMNRIRSSRRLEAACYNRLDVIWLAEGQKPDHSTLSGFIKTHQKYLRALFRDVVRVCVRAELVTLEHVAVDGTKVEGDAGKKSIRNKEKIERWLAHVDEKVTALESEWAENERREEALFGEQTPWAPPRDKNAKKSLASLKRQQQRLQEALEAIERRRRDSAGDKEPKAIASTTDPDARVMKDKEGRRKPNYNGQVAVDEAHGVIVAADANDEPDDSGQLTPMVEQTTENAQGKPQAVSADSNYNTGADLAMMEAQGIHSYLPDSGENSAAAPKDEATQQALEAVRQGQQLRPEQWEALPKNSQGLIDKSAFIYDREQNRYRCPAGYSLEVLRTSQDKKKWGTAIRKQYGRCPACATCQYAAQCCKDPQKGRTINRDQFEDCRERQRQRMATALGQETYARRKHTVEPRIGLIKHVMGIRRLMRRGLAMARTEWLMACTTVNIGVLISHWANVEPTL